MRTTAKILRMNRMIKGMGMMLATIQVRIAMRGSRPSPTAMGMPARSSTRGSMEMKPEATILPTRVLVTQTQKVCRVVSINLIPFLRPAYRTDFRYLPV